MSSISSSHNHRVNFGYFHALHLPLFHIHEFFKTQCHDKMFGVGGLQAQCTVVVMVISGLSSPRCRGLGACSPRIILVNAPRMRQRVSVFVLCVCLDFADFISTK